MPASKEEIVRAYRRAEQQAGELVAAAAESAWSRGAYEQGWNARQLLCHLADSCNVGRFLIAFAKDPRPAPVGADGTPFDIDKWNAQQVALREGKSIQELLTEMRVNVGREVEAIEATPDDVMAAQTRAPWGEEGALGDLIMGTISGHFDVHLADLRAATGGA